MKKILVLLFLFIASGSLFYSCQENYSEKDAMEALQKITLQISVIDASNGDIGITEAEVVVVNGATTLSATTNEIGVAIFEDFKISENVRVTATKNEYTTITTTVYATPDSYRETVVNRNISLYAISGDNIATITGQLTAEIDITNREREMLEGVEVIAYNSSLYGTSNHFSGITDSEGKYSIPVAIDGDGGNDIYVYFPSIERERTVGRAISNMYSIETKTAIYTASNYAETTIDRVPSALVEIEAPPASGSGFQLGTKAVRNALSTAVDNEALDAAILSGGSGYTSADKFVFESDPDGNQAELNIAFNADGVISNVSIINNGATYASMPAFTTNPTTGSGATFDFRFRSMCRIYIANYGSGYLSYPQVGIDYATTIDNTSRVKKEFYPDMNSYNPLGGGNLFNNAFISNGEIMVKDKTDGDTLFTTGYIYSLPLFTYSDEDRLQAKYYANLTAVNLTDGSLADNFSYSTRGDGYDYSNPPTVTITPLANYGSGALVRAEVDVNGQVSDLVLMTKGSGYTQDINDYDGDGNYQEEEDADMIGFSTWSTGYGRHDNVKPGMTYNGDTFYGTGLVKK